MLVLGVDPGSRTTGYGIVESKGAKLYYLGSGCIKLPISESFASRLKIIYSGISEIISKFPPHVFAIEKVFMAKNADSALKLGHARGVAVLAAANVNLEIFEYTPTYVKKTVVGKGHASKNQVRHMVCSLLNLNSFPQSDAADALAIAITHCNSQSY